VIIAETLRDNTLHSQQTSMPPVGFEPIISAGERPQTYAFDRAAVWTTFINIDSANKLKKNPIPKGTFNIHLSLDMIFTDTISIDPLLYIVTLEGYYKINSLTFASSNTIWQIKRWYYREITCVGDGLTSLPTEALLPVDCSIR